MRSNYELPMSLKGITQDLRKVKNKNASLGTRGIQKYRFGFDNYQHCN
jgi:hypothetical protein